MAATHLTGAKDDRPLQNGACRRRFHTGVIPGICCGSDGSWKDSAYSNPETSGGNDEEKVNRYGSRYTYYHCTKRRRDYTCREPYVREAALEDQIVDFLTATTLPDAFQRWCIERLAAMVAARDTDTERQRQSLQRAQAATARETENLTRLRLRDLLNDQEYAKERERLERERIRLAQNLDSLGLDAAWFEPAKEVICFCNRVAAWFRQGDLRTKRLIAEIVGSNFSLMGGLLRIDGRKPFVPRGGLTEISQKSG